MPLMRKRDLLVPLFLVLATCAAAQLSSSSDSCGSVDITGYGVYYTIKFNSYCQLRLSTTNLTLPVRKSSFKDCATACVAKGKSCGGIAYDRDSYYGENNCYLNRPGDFQKGTVLENAHFDSAVVDNSSLPIVRVDCGTSALNGVYLGYNVLCETAIPTEVDPSQISTVFASSMSDCITHCKNKTESDGSLSCYAVTWDPTTLYGYENCYLKGFNYVEPSSTPLWDSATLVGTTGRNPVDAGTSSATTTTTTLPSSSSSSSLPPSDSSQSPTTRLTTPQTAGVAAGSIFALLGSIASIFWFFRRRQNMREAEQNEAATRAAETPGHWRRELSEKGLVEKSGDPVKIHEMDAGATSSRSELNAFNAIYHADSKPITESSERS